MTELARSRKDSALEIHSSLSCNEGVLLIDDHGANPLLDLRASIQSPDAAPQELLLEQVASRRYQARFPLNGEGRYWATATGSGGEHVAQPFVVPYSQEYLRFSSDFITLNQIAEATGGHVLTGEESSEDIYSRSRPSKLSTQSVVAWLLRLLALLIPLDVGLRRIHLDWSLVKGWFSFGRAESNDTMNALLRRKQSLAESRPELRPSAQRRDSILQAHLPDPPRAASHRDPETPTSPEQAPTHTTIMLRRLAERQRERRR
jgi:hypothetical protein